MSTSSRPTRRPGDPLPPPPRAPLFEAIPPPSPPAPEEDRPPAAPRAAAAPREVKERRPRGRPRATPPPPPEPQRPPYRAPRVEPVDHRLTHLVCKLHTPAFTTPLSLAFTSVVPTRLARNDTVVVCEVAYRCRIKDHRNRLAAELEVTLVVISEAPADVTAEELDEFGSLQLLRFAHDTLRVYLHDYTGWMGLPPLVIEIPRDLIERQLALLA